MECGLGRRLAGPRHQPRHQRAAPRAAAAAPRRRRHRYTCSRSRSCAAAASRLWGRVDQQHLVSPLRPDLAAVCYLPPVRAPRGCDIPPESGEDAACGRGGGRARAAGARRGAPLAALHCTVLRERATLPAAPFPMTPPAPPGPDRLDPPLRGRWRQRRPARAPAEKARKRSAPSARVSCCRPLPSTLISIMRPMPLACGAAVLAGARAGRLRKWACAQVAGARPSCVGAAGHGRGTAAAAPPPLPAWGEGGSPPIDTHAHQPRPRVPACCSAS